MFHISLHSMCLLGLVDGKYSLLPCKHYLCTRLDIFRIDANGGRHCYECQFLQSCSNRRFISKGTNFILKGTAPAAFEAPKPEENESIFSRRLKIVALFHNNKSGAVPLVGPTAQGNSPFDLVNTFPVDKSIHTDWVNKCKLKN